MTKTGGIYSYHCALKVSQRKSIVTDTYVSVVNPLFPYRFKGRKKLIHIKQLYLPVICAATQMLLNLTPLDLLIMNGGEDDTL